LTRSPRATHRLADAAEPLRVHLGTGEHVVDGGTSSSQGSTARRVKRAAKIVRLTGSSDWPAAAFRPIAAPLALYIVTGSGEGGRG
jgi:hypothetical protein